MKTWIEVEARLPEGLADTSIFAEAFSRFGCSSSIESDDPPAIRGYLESVAGAQGAVRGLSEELQRLGALEIRVGEVPDEDWSEVWKAHFKPMRVGERMVIVPSWEKFDPELEDVIIRLDPGQAFGTGEHPTSRLCLRLLEGLELPGKSVLDLGCGSGILSIAAAKKGAARVTATDIEEAAVEIARENAAANGVSLELYAGAGFGEWADEGEGVPRNWDVVLSNIISATLIRLAPEVRANLREEGVWIVSGILTANWPDVLESAESCGFNLRQKMIEDDWIGAAFGVKACRR
jgi:ribosomal protein L11 methyltransferase